MPGRYSLQYKPTKMQPGRPTLITRSTPADGGFSYSSYECSNSHLFSSDEEASYCPECNDSTLNPLELSSDELPKITFKASCPKHGPLQASKVISNCFICGSNCKPDLNNMKVGQVVQSK